MVLLLGHDDKPDEILDVLLIYTSTHLARISCLLI